ncbi:SDR family NAD(P)-dependent oxidoreductase [Streptomyces sp. NPDC088348]|uniref:SDR family NAD(P)-dependent oxidoreductase n=1 Tax=Streptomyces sp. NPDC088348 TaxID=3365853 RepID=UPI0037FCFFD6
MTLQGRTALVTGGTSGIGRAVAMKLAHRGAYLTATIAPRMAARGGGAIISISTMAATIGMSGLAAYGASKAAIEALTKSWTAEYGPQGVRVNVVAPGPTRTPANAAMGEMFDALTATVPARRGADPDEIAEAVCFLASDEASFIYGAVLHADGGRVAV